MEAENSSETFLPIYQSTRRHPGSLESLIKIYIFFLNREFRINSKFRDTSKASVLNAQISFLQTYYCYYYYYFNELKASFKYRICSRLVCLGNCNPLNSSTSYTLYTIQTVYIHTTDNINTSLNCHCVYSSYLRISAVD